MTKARTIQQVNGVAWQGNRHRKAAAAQSMHRPIYGAALANTPEPLELVVHLAVRQPWRTLLPHCARRDEHNPCLDQGTDAGPIGLTAGVTNRLHLFRLVHRRMLQQHRHA